MNEKGKARLLFIFAGIIVILLIGICSWQLKEESKLVNKIEEIMTSPNPEVIYMTRPSCNYCNLLEPITDSLKEEYNLKYNTINVDEISNSQLNRILKLFGRSVDTFGTPYLVIVKDGKVIGEQAGFADENVIFDFFKKYEIIDNSEKLLINYINEENLNKIIEEKENKILLLGEIGNEKTVLAKEKIRSIIKENNLEINYFDITTIEDEKKRKSIINNLGYSEELTVPLLLIIEDGKIKISEEEINKYKNIIKENNYIK